MIYFVRHGQTDWNVQGKIQGTTDVPLNDVGKSQAQQVALQLKDVHFDKVFCSPLMRAQQTCQLICNKKQVVTTDNRIAERYFGEFEGLAKHQCDFDALWSTSVNQTFEKAESLQAFLTRVHGFAAELLANHHNKNVLVVAHGGVGMALKGYFDGAPQSGNYMDYLQGNAQVTTYPN